MQSKQIHPIETQSENSELKNTIKEEDE